jgi:hypothetical protein
MFQSDIGNHLGDHMASPQNTRQYLCYENLKSQVMKFNVTTLVTKQVNCEVPSINPCQHLSRKIPLN